MESEMLSLVDDSNHPVNLVFHVNRHAAAQWMRKPGCISARTLASLENGQIILYKAERAS
jgi:hypothetical protein